MKENISNIKSRDDLSENNKNIRKIMKVHFFFFKYFFFNMYKMFKISAETCAKNCVYNMIDKEKRCG